MSHRNPTVGVVWGCGTALPVYCRHVHDIGEALDLALAAVPELSTVWTPPRCSTCNKPQLCLQPALDDLLRVVVLFQESITAVEARRPRAPRAPAPHRPVSRRLHQCTHWSPSFEAWRGSASALPACWACWTVWPLPSLRTRPQIPTPLVRAESATIHRRVASAYAWSPCAPLSCGCLCEFVSSCGTFETLSVCLTLSLRVCVRLRATRPCQHKLHAATGAAVTVTHARQPPARAPRASVPCR